MSKQQVEDVVDLNELARRRQVIQDAANLVNYLPDALHERLQRLMPEGDDAFREIRTAVLELQLIAIQYGRALERRDNPRVQVVQQGRGPSKLLTGMMNRAQAGATGEPGKIIVVPSHAFDSKEKH